jgi:hypothetical protein
LGWFGLVWLDQGDIIDLKWAVIEDKPTSSVANIDDAVSKKHTQGTDQGLDTGGANAVTAAQAKAGYTHSGVITGNPHQVNKTDVGLSNVDNKSEATIITDVKADTDIDDAIDKKHSQGTDQGLDTGGANAVTAAHAPSDAVSLATVKADTDIDNAIDNTHAPHSDDQIITDQLSDLSDDATHRLVTDTEKSTWNDITTVALNVMLNAFRIAQIGSLTIFSMVKGFMDEYEDESGIDLVNSVNQTYNSSDDYYTPNVLNYGIDSYTKLALHLNNDVIDSSIIPKTVTNTGITFSDTIKKLGSHSAFFNTDYGIGLVVPHSDDFNFPGDFTVECWINPSSFPAEATIVGYRLDGNNQTHFLALAGNKLNTHIYASGLVLNMTSSLSLSTGVWYHVALVRNGTTWTHYINGTAYATTTSSQGLNGNESTLDIGAMVWWPYNGYIDEIRISNVARWTSNFTAPTEEYSALSIIENMTLKSNVQVASIIPVSSRIVLFEEDVDSVTINTDLKAYISRDNGTTYSQATLEDEGNYITGARILSGNVNISTQPSGSNIKYKIETLNNKNLKLHGVGISWK